MDRKLACLVALVLAHSAGASDLAILNVRVVEGEGKSYAPGSRATRGLTLEVTDESGTPVPSVSISFQLPEHGPSGTFLNGGRSDIANTGEDGRVSIWGMRWNSVPGAVPIRITAAKDGIRAGLIATVHIDASVREAVSDAPPRRSRKFVIGVAVATAAGAGLAAGMLRGSKSTPTQVPVDTVSIGPPAVSIGAPQ